MAENDRPRGILSPTDREFIKGEKEYGNRQTTYSRRETVRERVKNSLLDFRYLLHLDPEERAKIFEGYAAKSELRRAVRATLAFLYLGVVDQTGDATGVWKSANPHFEADLREGLQLALLKNDHLLEDLELTIETERVEGLEKALEAAETGEELSPEYIRVLMHSDAIDWGPVHEAIHEQLRAYADEHDDGA